MSKNKLPLVARFVTISFIFSSLLSACANPPSQTPVAATAPVQQSSVINQTTTMPMVHTRTRAS